METLNCKHQNRIKFNPEAPYYCPNCNTYDWYEGVVMETQDDVFTYQAKFPLDWFAKKLSVFISPDIQFLGNANQHTLHRIVIANRIVSKLLEEEVDADKYSMGDLFDKINKLLNIKRDKLNIKLNKMEVEIYDYIKINSLIEC